MHILNKNFSFLAFNGFYGRIKWFLVITLIKKVSKIILKKQKKQWIH